MSCCVRTPQEEWMDKGYDRTGRERIYRLIDKVKSKPPRVEIGRARLFTESFKETEGENISIRWAKAMLHVAENLPLYIDEDEILVGKITDEIGRNSLIFPELEGRNLLELEHAHKRPTNAMYIRPEDLEILKNEIYPYWQNHSYVEAYAKALPEETRQVIYGEDKNNFSKIQYVLTPSTMTRASTNFNFDYETLLKRGLQSYMDEAQREYDACKKDPRAFLENGFFWEAAIISIQAISTFIMRYANEAHRLAAIEADEKRKAELQQIAENCAWIATMPAKDFRTAIQLQWFAHLYIRMEQNVGPILGTSRMDQHLLPYYRQDIENGTITREEAKELLENYWVGMAQIIYGPITDAIAKVNEGYSHFETVTIGGQTREGQDATNELSYLILDSARGLPITYPDLAARIHSGTPDKFLRACVEVVKEGQGYPKFLNDEEIVSSLLAKGVKYGDALDYAVAGCTELRVPNVDTYINGGININLGVIVEMALHNGWFKHIDKQMGPQTGDPRTFETFDDFFDAYRTQHEYFLYHAVVQQLVGDKVKPNFLAAPFSSVLVGACRAAAVDINDYVPNSFREVFFDGIGFATLVDSLTAVKKLVYDDKVITMDELITALDANFEGYEYIRQLCLNAPKFGNNDPYADEIGKRVDLTMAEFFAKHRGTNGDLLVSRCVPITAHIPKGTVTAATPDGRKAGDYLSEGMSASHGAEKSGPTAILLSNKNIKNNNYVERAGKLLNIKLSPAAVAGEEGTKKFMSFIRTWCDLKIWHVQFNIINKETLLAAKANPEAYKDLVVRVAGYSAYFTDLSERMQDEIIERTEMDI